MNSQKHTKSRHHQSTAVGKGSCLREILDQNDPQSSRKSYSRVQGFRCQDDSFCWCVSKLMLPENASTWNDEFEQGNLAGSLGSQVLKQAKNDVINMIHQNCSLKKTTSKKNKTECRAYSGEEVATQMRNCETKSLKLFHRLGQ